MQRWTGFLLVAAVTSLTMLLLRPALRAPPPTAPPRAPEPSSSPAAPASPSPLDPTSVEEVELYDSRLSCFTTWSRSRTWRGRSMPSAALAEVVRRVQAPVPLEDFPRAAGLTEQGVEDHAAELLAAASRAGFPDRPLEVAELARHVIRARQRFGSHSTTQVKVRLTLAGGGRTLRLTSDDCAGPGAPLPWTVELDGHVWESYDSALNRLVVGLLDRDSPNRPELILDPAGDWFWKRELPSALEHARR